MLLSQVLFFLPRSSPQKLFSGPPFLGLLPPGVLVVDSLMLFLMSFLEVLLHPRWKLYTSQYWWGRLKRPSAASWSACCRLLALSGLVGIEDWAGLAGLVGTRCAAGSASRVLFGRHQGFCLCLLCLWLLLLSSKWANFQFWLDML